MPSPRKRTVLDNRHPDYERLAPDWLFWQQSYEAGAAYRQSEHLFRFPKETAANYSARLKRASRINFTKQVLDLMIQYLAKEAPARKKELASTALQEFWKDTDRRGTGIDDFMKHIGLMTALYGRYYIMVDKPTTVAKNKLEQKHLKLKPYVYGITPLDVLDLVYDEFSGKITQVLIREYTRGSINLLEARSENTLQERYRLWLKTREGVQWVLWRQGKDGNVEELDRGLANIPEIPIVEVHRLGGSLVEDIATLDRKVFNYESLLDQILYEQTFSTLRLPWSGRTEEFYEQWELTVGTKSILPYDPSTGAAPDFISPDAQQGELILKAIEQTISRIYQAKNLLDTMGSVQSSPANPSSGIARGYDFEKLNASLAAFADDLERADETLARFVNLWEGEKEEFPEDLIDYPDTFDIKTLLQSLEEAKLLSQSVYSDTFRRNLQKSLVQKAASKLSPQEFQTIMNEIEESQSGEDALT